MPFLGFCSFIHCIQRILPLQGYRMLQQTMPLPSWSIKSIGGNIDWRINSITIIVITIKVPGVRRPDLVLGEWGKALKMSLCKGLRWHTDFVPICPFLFFLLNMCSPGFTGQFIFLYVTSPLALLLFRHFCLNTSQTSILYFSSARESLFFPSCFMHTSTWLF